MRSYFWIREHSRGNVVAHSQYGDLSETELLFRNCKTPSAPRECADWFPSKEFILRKFSKPGTFAEEREEFIYQMTCGGAVPLDCSLNMALNDARLWVCNNGSEVAITARAYMLHQTLIHYNSMPPLSADCNGDYFCSSPCALVSNGKPIYSTDCGGAVFFHPFAWEYYARERPKQSLFASSELCFIGVCVGKWTGNLAWDVRPDMEGHRFVDFAAFFSNWGGYCAAFPSDRMRYGGYYQDRNLPTCGGVPAYYTDKRWVVLDSEERDCSYWTCGYCTCGHNCTWWDCICGKCVSEWIPGEYIPPEYIEKFTQVPTLTPLSWDGMEDKWYFDRLRFVVPTDADGMTQQAHCAYDSICFNGEDFSKHLYRAYTGVNVDPWRMGVSSPWYRNFQRETFGDETAMRDIEPSALGQFLYCHTSDTLPCAQGSPMTRSNILNRGGAVIGEYSSPDAAYEGRRTGAILKMEAPQSSEPVGSTDWYYHGYLHDRPSAWDDYEIGDYVPGVRRIAWQAPACGDVVTLQSTDEVNAGVYLCDFNVTAWDAEARIRFVLDCSENWEEYDSAELWEAFSRVMHAEHYVYIRDAGGSGISLPFVIEEHGIEASAPFDGTKATLTLYEMCILCGITPTVATVGECYELLSAGLTLVWHLNHFDPSTPPYAGVKSIGISPTFSDEPCVNWLCR